MIKVLLATLFITSCGALERCSTKITGNLTYKCSKSGVEYVQSDSGIARHDNREGKPVKCDN